jgi:hypothetical protein
LMILPRRLRAPGPTSPGGHIFIRRNRAAIRCPQNVSIFDAAVAIDLMLAANAELGEAAALNIVVRNIPGSSS